MKKKIILLITLLIIIGITIYKLPDSNKYVPSDSEKELINYFKEIALNSEFDDSAQKVTKWRKSMNVFIFKNKELAHQVKVIRNTIDRINTLVNDGFEIKITEDPSISNSFIFLMEKEKANVLIPDTFRGIEEDFAGLAEIEFDLKTYEITKAIIFINTNENIELQESAIVEEITQSIGLMNDSRKYSNSIFYQDKTDSISFINYSKLDIELIKMLYHPKMLSGLNPNQTEEVIIKILQE